MWKWEKSSHGARYKIDRYKPTTGDWEDRLPEVIHLGCDHFSVGTSEISYHFGANGNTIGKMTCLDLERTTKFSKRVPNRIAWWYLKCANVEKGKIKWQLGFYQLHLLSLVSSHRYNERPMSASHKLRWADGESSRSAELCRFNIGTQRQFMSRKKTKSVIFHYRLAWAHSS